jgi:hypothetical protein
MGYVEAGGLKCSRRPDVCHLPCPHLYACGGFGERFYNLKGKAIVECLSVGVGVLGDGVKKGWTGCGVSMAVHSN